MIMEGSLPYRKMISYFMNLPGYAGFVCTNNLVQRWIPFLFIITSDNQDHMNMIWHYHKFIHSYTEIMCRNLRYRISRYLTIAAEIFY